MKIVQAVNTDAFSNVKSGQAFGFSGHTYVKATHTITGTRGFGVNGVNDMTNAVRLNDGYFGYFKDDTRVRVYDKAVVVLNEGSE